MNPVDRRPLRFASPRAGRILAAAVLAFVMVVWLAARTEALASSQGLRVDGRPFFPLGLYWAPAAKFAQLREMGFNIVHLWGSNVEATRRGLDEAHRLGMRAVIELSEHVRGTRPLETVLKPIVDGVRTHPALLAWYLVDEPNPGALARIQQGYPLLRRTQPTHPVLIVHYEPDVIRMLAPYMDVLGVDWYPVPNLALSTFSRQIHRAKMVAGSQKPIWAVLQAFNKEVGGRPTRYPTPTELRNMVYQSIVAGATGVLYFSYSWQGVLEERAPDLWTALGRINRELTTLAPILLEGVRPAQGIRVNALHDVQTLIRQWSGQTYVIAVNVGASKARVQVHRQSGGSGRVESLFDAWTGQMRQGTFTDTLEAYEVRVYRM